MFNIYAPQNADTNMADELVGCLVIGVKKYLALVASVSKSAKRSSDELAPLKSASPIAAAMNAGDDNVNASKKRILS